MLYVITLRLTLWYPPQAVSAASMNDGCETQIRAEWATAVQRPAATQDTIRSACWKESAHSRGME